MRTISSESVGCLPAIIRADNLDLTAEIRHLNARLRFGGKGAFRDRPPFAPTTVTEVQNNRPKTETDE